MKAAVWHGRRDIRVEEVAEPPAPPPGQVKIKVSWCGICGTDLHEYTAGPVMIGEKPHPLTGRHAPITLGHELSGTVVEVGAEVENVAVGDRVAADAAWRCGVCFWCRRGEYNVCQRGGSLGLHSDGGFAPYLNAPAYMLHVLPPNIPDEVGALIEPLAVGVHAIRRAGLQLGDSVAIVGAGPVGQAVLQAARAAGAGQIFVVETMAARQQLALDLGATEVLDPRAIDAGREIFKRTGRVGADIAIECIGNPKTAGEAIGMARRGGKVVIAGVFEEPAAIDLNRLVIYERTLIGTLGYAGEFPTVIVLLADGRLRGEPLISHRIGIDQIVAEGFESILADRSNKLKVIVRPE